MSLVERPIPLRSERADFHGVSVIIVLYSDDSTAIAFDSVKAGCKSDGKISILHSKSYIEIIPKKNGFTESIRLVSEADFLEFALQDDRFTEFRVYTVKFMQSVKTKGIGISPDVAEHPTMKLIQGLAETAAIAIRAEQKADAAMVHSQAVAVSHKELVEDFSENKQLTETLYAQYNDENGYENWLTYLNRKGVDIPRMDGTYSAVGKELAGIARKCFRDDPDSRKPSILHNKPFKTYKPEVMDYWIGLNRVRPDRASWFLRCRR